MYFFLRASKSTSSPPPPRTFHLPLTVSAHATTSNDPIIRMQTSHLRFGVLCVPEKHRNPKAPNLIQFVLGAHFNTRTIWRSLCENEFPAVVPWLYFPWMIRARRSFSMKIMRCYTTHHNDRFHEITYEIELISMQNTNQTRTR